jgi:hypothetical protein
MSAGDVKFIGWQGTNPSYQELEPSISYEPFRQIQNSSLSQRFASSNVEIAQYVRAKVTRTLILFSKDKDLFIGGLEYSNNTLNLTYIDSDGSIKTKNYGNGWEITTFDESPAAKGYTQIKLSYEKAIAKSLAFYGVDGLSVDCVDGVCRIRYKNNNLETIDSGTGVCTTGLQFFIERLTPSALSGDLFNEATIAELKASPYYRVQVICNDVISDVTEIVGSDLPQKSITSFLARQELVTTTFQREYVSYPAAVQGYQDFLTRELWDAEEIAQVVAGIKSSYPDTENVKTTVDIQQTPTVLYVPVRQPLIEDQTTDPTFTKTSASKLIATITRRAIVGRTTSYPSEINQNTLVVRWEKQGNIIRLVFGGSVYLVRGERVLIQPVVKTIREYDVTGLS